MEQVKKFVDREIGDNPKWKGRENVVETKEVDEKKDVSYVNMAMEYLRNRNQDSTCKFEISTIKKNIKNLSKIMTIIKNLIIIKIIKI